MKNFLLCSLLSLYTISVYSQTLTDSLLLYYNFENGAVDISGNGYDGVLNATPVADRFGISGSAMSFNGIDEYIDFPNLKELKPELPVSFSFWIKYDSPDRNDRALFNTSFMEDRSAGISFNNTANTGRYAIGMGDGSFTYSAQTRRTFISNAAIDDEWHHIGVIIRSADDIQLFVDCEDPGGEYSGTGGDLVYADMPGSLGRHDVSTNEAAFHFEGILDEFRYWNRALAPEEIMLVCPDLPCLEETISFADEVISYNPQCEDDIDPLLNQPDKILGPPDFEGPDVNFTLFGDNFVSLGEGGSITVRFTDNILTNSGNADPDLWIFEVGEAVQAIVIELRPIDQATINSLNNAGIIDTDQDGFYLLDTLLGSTSFLDIDSIVSGLSGEVLQFDAVRIIDVENQACLGSGAPGADIDAICALSTLQVIPDEEICNNGIDDDGDGLIDCEDADCEEFAALECLDCLFENISFADTVLSTNFECIDDTNPGLDDPTNALGFPDYVDSATSGTQFGTGFVSIGEGGSITLGFVDNILTNSGNADPDLWVFEVGPRVEPSTIALRPADLSTAQLLDNAGLVSNNGFYNFGAIGGSTSFLDIDAIVPGFALGDLIFDAVIITDVAENPCTGTGAPGADIDAICALSTIPALPEEICDNGIDDDGDGDIDCADSDLADDCCCRMPPVIDVGPDVIDCEGETVTLEVTLTSPGNPNDMVSYLWSNGSTSESIDVFTAGVFTCFATDVCGNVGTDEVNVDFLDNVQETLSATICDGDSFPFNGEALTIAGQYEFTTLSSFGCDSTVTLFLDVLPTTSQMDSFQICEGDAVIINGFAFTQPGLNTITLSGANGCDSILNFSIEILPTNIVEENISICEGDSFLFNGEALTIAGQYEFTTLSSFGCDSTVTLFLDVLPTTSQMDSFQICEGDAVIINGFAFTQPGLNTITLSGANGCDSILNFSIEILPTNIIEENFSICEDESIVINGSTFSSAGTFQQMISNPNGCDDLFIINLEVLDNAMGFLDQVGCEGDMLTVNGISYSSGGVFQQNLIGANGCDSLLTIDVELIESFQGEDTFYLNPGQTVTVNGETFDVEGQFVQNLNSSTGCDSSLVINILESNAIVSYDFNACTAFIEDMTNADYSEFTPVFPSVLSCGNITASNIFRDPPQTNRHSCTPGLNDSESMCISSAMSCSADFNSSEIVRFTMNLTPTQGEAIVLTGLEFYQQAPENFDWIDGDSGLNNYPTLYAVRVLQDGTEIYRQDNNATSTDWQRQEHFFDPATVLIFENETALEIQLLSYCPVGVMSEVTAWDFEDLKLFGACGDTNTATRSIGGQILSYNGAPVENVELTLEGGLATKTVVADELGFYHLANNFMEESYRLSAYNNDNHLRGVNTRDLISIQRHILGLESFDNLLSYQAADINNDNRINGSDLLELRKLILGIYNELPENTSYEFYSIDYLNGTALDPWKMSEQVLIPQLNQHELNTDFVPVKIGDVTELEFNSRESLVQPLVNDFNLKVEVSEIDANRNELTFSLFRPQFLDGLQLSIDLEGIEFIELNSGNLDGLEFFLTNNNVLNISWIGLSESPTEVSELFRIQLGSNIVGDLLEKRIINAEAYVENQVVTLQSDGFEALNQKLVSDLQVYPNPFSVETILSFLLSQDGPISLVVYDAQGRKVMDKNMILSKGLQTINLSSELFSKGDNGLYLLQLSTENQTYHKRLVYMR